MKTIVFIETNFSGLDALTYCRSKDYKSILVTDNPERFNDWFPKSVLHKINSASEILKVKNSNDFDELKKVLSQIPHIDAILTFAEIRTLVVARLSEYFGLKGTPVAAVELAQDKFRFRQKMNETQVDILYSQYLESIEDLIALKSSLKYPFFIKPAHGHSSIGAMVCQSEDKLMEVYHKLRKIHSEGISKSFVVDEYLDGPLYSVEMFTTALSQHQVLGISDRRLIASSIEIGATFPVHPHMHESMIRLAKSALNAIGYSFGASHVEMILTPNGPHLVEVNTRMGGSGHSVMLDHALERSIPGDCVELHLGTHDTRSDLYQPKLAASWQCFTNSQAGSIKKLADTQKIKDLPGIIEVWNHHEEGDILKDLDSNFNWITQVMSVGSDADIARSRALHAVAFAKIHCEMTSEMSI